MDPIQDGISLHVLVRMNPLCVETERRQIQKSVTNEQTTT